MIKGISPETIVEQSENKIVVDVSFSADCDYFDGHFPQFKLLPAVAEFTIVSGFAKKYLGASSFVSKIQRMKFSSPLLPDTTARFTLKSDIAEDGRKKISFEITDSSDERKKISSGSFYA